MPSLVCSDHSGYCRGHHHHATHLPQKEDSDCHRTHQRGQQVSLNPSMALCSILPICLLSKGYKSEQTCSHILTNIFNLQWIQRTCHLGGVAHCDKPTEKYHPTLQFTSAPQSIYASFISLFWFYGPQINILGLVSWILSTWFTAVAGRCVQPTS